MPTSMDYMVHENSQLVPPLTTMYQITPQNHTTMKNSESNVDASTKYYRSNQASISIFN